MLDEWMEQKVDEACEVVPAYVNPRKIRLASSHVGWRLYLYGSGLKRAVSGFFVHIRSEQDMDIFLRETAEKSDTTILRIKRFLREKARLLAVLDDAGMRLRFATTLYLFGLAALGTLAVGGREMALCALAACLMLLSAAMELGYEPICAGIRQRYLFSVGLRTLALTVPLADYFGKYLMAGVASNVVLQSLMIVMLGVHLALFFALICFNRRQSPMLRALSGVLGVFPALTASAAAALAVCLCGGQLRNYEKLVSDQLDGTQDAYIAQFQREYALCEAAGAADDVVLPAWTVQTVTGKPTAYEDAAFWTNEAMAQYFGVKSVRVE